MNHKYLKEDPGYHYVPDIQGKASTKPEHKKWETKLFKTKCDPRSLKCEPITIYFDPHLKVIGSSVLEIKNVWNLNTVYMIEKFELTYTTSEPSFTHLMSITKVSFFALSLVSLVIFWMKLKKVSPEARTWEQGMVLKLSVLLLGYNDPLYAIILYSPTIFK
jgi:hypothetical protein